MIEALLLDLDNTLVDRDAAFLGWLASLGVDPAMIALDRGGYGSKPALFERIAAETGLSRGEVRVRFFRDFPAFSRLRLDAEALLSAWSGPTVIVTNGPSSMQRAKIAAAGLEGRVSAIVVSGEVGVEKPDPAIFRAALDRAEVPAERACMVGDHPVNDVGGARAAGIQAVFLTNRWFTAPEGVPSVDDLRDVPARLGRA